MANVSLDYREPCDALRDHVSLFYEFKADLPAFEDDERADLAQIRFLLKGDKPTYRFADGHRCDAPHIQLLGPTTGPTRTGAQGPIHVFGWGLRPAGWADFVGLDASLLLNRVVDACEVFGEVMKQLADAFRAAETLDARVAIATAAATRLRHERTEGASAFTRLVDHWLASSASPEVEELERAAGCSRRQLERKCKQFYGVPPKLLARKYRALKAAVAIAQGDADMATVIARDFYDQPHFIREIKQFTGVTPKRLTADLPTLAQLTMRRTEFQQLSPLVTKV